MFKNLLKKTMFIVCITCLSLTLSSCTKDNLPYTYDALYMSNTVDKILEKHSSVSYTFNNLINDTQSYNMYISDTDYSLERKDYVRITTDNEDYYYDKKLKTMDRIYNASYDTFRNKHGIWCIIYNPQGTEEVEITKITKDKIYLNVYLRDEESAKSEIEYLTDRSLIGSQYVMYEVTLDRETMFASSFNEYIVNDNGYKEEIARVENLSYDKDINTFIKDAKKYKEELENLDEDSFRTLNIVKNPKTENEELLIYKAKKGISGSVYIAVDDKVYEDYDCTIPYSYKEDLDSDITLYIVEGNNTKNIY